MNVPLGTTDTGFLKHRFVLPDAASTVGDGLVGLTSASSGLIISTHCDNEAAATVYTVAGSTIETITTIGTYAAPTATKCRIKEVDATNQKGKYEFQFAAARFNVTGAKYMDIDVRGATNLAQQTFRIYFDAQVMVQPSGLNQASLSADSGLRASRVSTLTAGNATTITLDASANAEPDFYFMALAQIVSGAGVGQGRLITDYDGASKVATVNRAWAPNNLPTAGSIVHITPIDGILAASAAQIATAFLAALTADNQSPGSVGLALASMNPMVQEVLDIVEKFLFTTVGGVNLVQADSIRVNSIDLNGNGTTVPVGAA